MITLYVSQISIDQYQLVNRIWPTEVLGCSFPYSPQSWNSLTGQNLPLITVQRRFKSFFQLTGLMMSEG